MRRLLLNGLRVLLGITACVMVVVTSILGVLFFRPAWIINEHSATRFVKMAEGSDIHVRWQDLSLQALKPAFAVHKIAWKTAKLCVDAPRIPVHFCSESFAGQFDLVWNLKTFPQILHVRNLGSWNLAHGDLRVGPFAASSDPSSFDINAVQMPWIIEGATLQPSVFSFDRINVVLDTGILEGPLKIVLTQDRAKPPLDPALGSILKVSVNDANQEIQTLCWRTTVAQSRLDRPARPERCIDHISVDASLGVRSGLLRVTQLGPLKLRADQVHLNFASSRPQVASVAPPEPDQTADFEFPPILAGAVLAPVEARVEKSSLVFSASQRQWRFRGDLALQALGFGADAAIPTKDIMAKFTTQNFCADIPYLEGCFQSINLAARVGTGDSGSFEVHSVQSATASADSLTFLIPESEPARSRSSGNAEPPKTADYSQMLSIPFENRDRNHYHMRIKRFLVIPTDASGKRKSSLAQGQVSLDLVSTANQRSRWNMSAHVMPVIAKTKGTRLASNVDQQPKSDKADLMERLQTVSTTLHIDADKTPLAGPYGLDWDAKAQFSTGESAQVSFSGKQDAQGLVSGLVRAKAIQSAKEVVDLVVSGKQSKAGLLNLDGTLTVNDSRWRANPGLTLKAIIDREKTYLALHGQVDLQPKLARIVLPNITATTVCNEEPPPGPNLDLSGIKTDACEVHLNYADGFARAKLNLNCPLHLSGSLTSPEAESHKMAHKMSVDLATSFYAEGGDAGSSAKGPMWKGGFDVSLLRYDSAFAQNWLDLATNLTATFSAPQKDPLPGLSWQTSGQMDLKIKRFSALVELLRHLPYAIPSPLNVLEGTATAHAEVSGDSIRDLLVVPFSVGTDLRADKQVFNLVADGSAVTKGIRSGKAQASADVKLLLQDIALTLPKISLREKFPMLFPDSRIDPGTCRASADTDAAKSNSEDSVIYKIAIDTPEQHPVKISTNLTKDEIPISLNGIVMDNNGLTGRARVDKFAFDVFRRHADVKSFDVAMVKGQDSPTINGNIEFKYTDITINLLIRGTAEEPMVTFESNPIRTDRELIAILLYGEDSTTFDDDQLQTADDLSAAFADQMIGLASLFMLAETPVESVRYNPATKSFNAKVRLDGETSLNLGTTNESDQRVGVRHRLSSTWSVETDVSKDSTTDTTSGTAILEWSKRF